MALSAASEPQNDTVLIAEGRGLFLSTDLASLAFSFFFFSLPRQSLAGFRGEWLTEPGCVNPSCGPINLLATQPDKQCKRQHRQHS